MPPESLRGAVGQLVDVAVTGIAFQRNWSPEHIDEAEPPAYLIDTSTQTTVDDDRTGAVVEFEARVEWRSEGEAADGPFDLSITLEALFEWGAPDAPVEGIQGWLAFNADHLLWPYLRAEIARITVASGLPPMTIFTIAVPRPHLGRVGEQPVTEDAES